MNIIDTKYFRIDPKVPNLTHIQKAAETLREGGIVAFPTETVYGLGANALNEKAVQKIFKAKGRPSDNPLIVHIASHQEVGSLTTEITDKAKYLMDIFWPGPLTLIMHKSSKVPDSITAGLDTVAIRMPSHPVSLALIKAARVPIAAPSANLSGKPSPTTGEHVLKDLKGKVDIILDGGKSNVGLESTILDITGEIPLILRPGGITYEHLKEVLDEVDYDPALKNGFLDKNIIPKAPGMKYTHYSPKAKVYLIKGEKNKVAEKFKEKVLEAKSKGLRVGILCTEEMLFLCRDLNFVPDHWEILGCERKILEVATKLYGSLRNCDRYGLDIVFSQTFYENGIGTAIMNRLKKAAGYRIIEAK